jgi:two-component system osmolarity sensor histidine kinase EnvZ
MLLSVLAWFKIYTYFAREPRALQSAQMVTSVVNMTRAALIAAQPSKRRDLLLELSEREGIRVYPAEADDQLVPLADEPLLRMLAEKVRSELGLETRLGEEVDGEPGLWVSFRIDEDEYWAVLPHERLEQTFPAQWIGWGAAALVISVAGAYSIVFRVTRPLKALSAAAQAIGRGEAPAALDERGPTEFNTVSKAFNQMSRDLAQLDADRALILAGISHDLRTPLARLRLGVEMSNADDATREGMQADIEDVDRIIGQFLDFARETSGEAPIQLSPNTLVQELAEQYAKRGTALETELAQLPQLPIREKAIRRALTNLIENALHYAGEASQITLRTRREHNAALMEVLDRGPGIPPEQAARVKRPFTRLEAARTDASGAGLGLAIVDRIARAHGGRLELLPREGGGLIAQLSLPLSTPRS